VCDAKVKLPVPPNDPQDVDVVALFTPLSKSTRSIVPRLPVPKKRRKRAIDGIGGQLMSREETLEAYERDEEKKEAKRAASEQRKVEVAKKAVAKKRAHEETMRWQAPCIDQYIKSVDPDHEPAVELNTKDLQKLAHALGVKHVGISTADVMRNLEASEFGRKLRR
jgi:hypothetical protein